MTIDFVELDVDEILSMFKLVDGRIIRNSDNVRWDGIDITDNDLVRIGKKRTTVNRIMYVLMYGINPEGEVMTNDKGELVDVTNNHFRQVLVKAGDNVTSYDMGYLGRYVNKSGIRIGKRFNTYKEAKEYSKAMTIEVWGEYASRLGFKL